MNKSFLENNVCSHKQLLELVTSYTPIEVEKYTKGHQLNYVWVTKSLYDLVLQDKISKCTRDLEIFSNYSFVCILMSMTLV